MKITHIKKYSAECIGTFALAFAVSMSLSGVFPIPTPVIAALVLMLFVYTVGHISGTHINPAITIGVWSIGKISSSDALGYLIAQFLGGGIAYYLTRILIIPARVPVANSAWVGIGEMIGAFFLAFGISAVLYKKVPVDIAGVVIGGSLLLGASLASPLSNGIFNPAVALAAGSISFMYLLAPIIGAVLAMHAYTWLAGGSKSSQK